MAMASAAKVIEATYECAFNSHASFGPACAVVDPTNDQLIIWSGSQKIYDNRRGIADFLGMSVEKVRAIWFRGPDLMVATSVGTSRMKPHCLHPRWDARSGCSG
jgi:hypothetical protein